MNIAKSFVTRSPTFRFDGIHQSLEFIRSVKPQYGTWYIFKFNSRHGGFGDRTNKVLAQKITSHTAEIFVRQMLPPTNPPDRVTMAVLDNQWNMIHQRKLLVSIDDAIDSAEILNVDLDIVGLPQWRNGIEVELEHGKVDMRTNVTDNMLIPTAKIALAHLNEYPDYYHRLEQMEYEAELYWSNSIPSAIMK